MSLTRKAARGAAWTILFGLGARGIGVAGTLVMTHLIAPEVVGEVAVATIIVMIFSWITNWGFSSYAVVKGRGDEADEVTWHCTVAHAVMGGAGMLIVALVGGYMTPWFSAPDAAQYVPGMAIALGLKRVATMPERVLIRDLHFRATSISMAVGELVYAATSVFLAWRGYGGMAVVYGNIVQSLAVLGVLCAAAGVRSWATPTKLHAARFRDMIRYGWPLGIESVAHNAARYLDKILISRHFQPGPMAQYNMGYNLADIPAVYVGEQIGQVLLPSLAALPRERQPAALERATALLALVIFPMAVGLASVADSLVAVALSDEWQEVAPLLTILAVLAVFRPITWTLGTYLEATAQTRQFMWLELIKVVVLIAGVEILQRWGIHAAAFAVGIAFGTNALLGVWIVISGAKPRPSAARLFSGFARPLLACAAMMASVFAIRFGMQDYGVEHPGVLLITEIIVGAAVYVVAAFVFAKPIAQDFLHMLRQLRRRGAPAPE